MHWLHDLRHGCGHDVMQMWHHQIDDSMHSRKTFLSGPIVALRALENRHGWVHRLAHRWLAEFSWLAEVPSWIAIWEVLQMLRRRLCGAYIELFWRCWQSRKTCMQTWRFPRMITLWQRQPGKKADRQLLMVQYNSVQFAQQIHTVQVSTCFTCPRKGRTSQVGITELSWTYIIYHWTML